MYARHDFGAQADAPPSSEDRSERTSQFARAAALVASIDLSVITRRMITNPEGPRWSAEQAARAETRYRRFLQMAIVAPDLGLAPTRDIDIYWHDHILHTRAYHRDCETLFGHYLHHDAGFGVEAKDAAAKLAFDGATAALYEEMFGERYLAADKAAHCTVFPCIVDPVAATGAKSAALRPALALDVSPAHCTVFPCIVDPAAKRAPVQADGPSPGPSAHCTVFPCIVDPVAAPQAQGAALRPARAADQSVAHCTVFPCIVDPASKRAPEDALQASAHCTVFPCIVDPAQSPAAT